jgi:hypothetical protein
LWIGTFRLKTLGAFTLSSTRTQLENQQMPQLGVELRVNRCWAAEPPELQQVSTVSTAVELNLNSVHHRWIEFWCNSVLFLEIHRKMNIMSRNMTTGCHGQLVAWGWQLRPSFHCEHFLFGLNPSLNRSLNRCSLEGCWGSSWARVEPSVKAPIDLSPLIH